MAVSQPMSDCHTFLLFSGFSNVYHSACVWPTALKLGCITNFDMLFLMMGFILVGEIQFMLISIRHICIRSILCLYFCFRFVTYSIYNPDHAQLLWQWVFFTTTKTLSLFLIGSQLLGITELVHEAAMSCYSFACQFRFVVKKANHIQNSFPLPVLFIDNR